MLSKTIQLDYASAVYGLLLYLRRLNQCRFRMTRMVGEEGHIRLGNSQGSQWLETLPLLTLPAFHFPLFTHFSSHRRVIHHHRS